MQFLKKLTIFFFFFIFYFQNVNAERIVYINMEKILNKAFANYKKDVLSQKFPDKKHTY